MFYFLLFIGIDMNLSDQALEEYLNKPLNRLSAITAILKWEKDWNIHGQTFKDLRSPRNINEICLAVHVLMTFTFATDQELKEYEKATNIRLSAVGAISEYIDKLYPALEKLVLRIKQDERDKFFKSLDQIIIFFRRDSKAQVNRLIKDIKNRYSSASESTEQQHKQTQKRSLSESDHANTAADIKLTPVESKEIEEDFKATSTKRACLRYYENSVAKPDGMSNIDQENADEFLNSMLYN
jgi:hypothetical protein